MSTDDAKRPQRGRESGQELTHFTEQRIENISAYLNTLKRIHIRLMVEGYRIVDGEIVPPGQPEKAES